MSEPALIRDQVCTGEEAWNVAIASYKNFLQGMGHLRVHTKAPGETS